MIYNARSGHIGASLSCVDILTALYFGAMKHDPENPKWDSRDRFVLSKGHAAPALYAVLAEAGYFHKDDLMTLRRIDSDLPGHPDLRTIGVDASSGSLGQGISIAVGMALAGKMDNRGYNVYVLIGDGEMQEGQVWEALMSASNYDLNNLTIIIDRNKLQTGGKTEDIMALEPLVQKLLSFALNVTEINGHDFNQILTALGTATQKNKLPTVIIAHTIKGKGVSFMENNIKFHDELPSEEEYKKAMEELA